MARWAIGDVQGCCAELRQLLARIRYSPSRDRLWFTGDLVNRGPESLESLRLVHSLGDSAVTVLGNHDLHLLAVGLAGAKLRKGDTLDDVLAAPDRERLLEWLLQRPLLHRENTDVLVHAGLLPQWTGAQALQLADEVSAQLARLPAAVLGRMYGNEPDRWSDSLRGADRLRLCINAFTRLRFCDASGRIDLQRKDAPADVPPPWMPWFKVPARANGELRIVFGHWSALGLYRGDGVIGLDSGCVWGGALTALNLDDPQAPPVSVPSRQPLRRE